MKKIIKKLKTDSKLLLNFMILFATILLLFFFIWVGLVIFFYIALIIWIIFIFIYFKILFNQSFIFRIIVFLLITLLTVGLISWAMSDKLNSKSANEKVINGISLEPCTKTLSDSVLSIPGTKVSLYSAPTGGKNSPTPAEANNVRTFSLKGTNDKTEKNSFYGEFRMADDSTIKGYDEEMEVCNEDNMANKYYTVKYHDASDIVSEDNVTARVHYLFGNKYIAEPGNYRVDYLVRDKADGVWKLTARVTGITITE